MADDRLRILVVDDDVGVTELVRAALEAQGYDVCTANDGQRGLELAFTEHPDLVLLDVMMPDMDGFQVCRELQAGFTRDIPVVFLTAKTDLDDMMTAGKAGASRYVTKPFRLDHLLGTVGEVLRDAAVHVDETTGLPTLATVQVDIQRMLYRRTDLGILYVTLEGIESLERLRGIGAVDDVLRRVARRLAAGRGRVVRADDLLSVSGSGDAFLFVLAPPRERDRLLDDDVLAVKRRLEDELLAGIDQEVLARLPVEVGLCAGYARLTQTPNVRLGRALIDAIERAGRSVEQERDEARQHLRQEFDRLVGGEQLSCVCQPIVSLSDFSVLGYELLARGPQSSPLHLPDPLFEVARGFGREAELDRLCRLAAVRTAGKLPADCLRFINIAPSTMAAGDGEPVAELLDAIEPDARPRTIIELTETSVIEDFDRMREMVGRLREHGLRIAIDDAGAGHSGLQTIVELEPDFIKLDRSLIRDVEASLVKRRLLARLRDFCRDAGVTLIAEGIETRPQLDALLGLGIPYGQGFLFARPAAPAAAAGAVLEPGGTDGRRLCPEPSVVESRPL